MSGDVNYRVLYNKAPFEEQTCKFYSAPNYEAAVDMFRGEYAYCNDGASIEELDYCVLYVDTIFGWLNIWDLSKKFNLNK